MSDSFLGDLAGKSAIVTGASAGIGAAIARSLGRHGAQVALVGRDTQRLQAVADTISADSGTAVVVAVDLAAPGGPAKVVGQSLDAFGRIDVLVHNAGIFEFGPFEEASLTGFDQQWVTNVRAPFELTQVALPHLNSGSTIVFVGSNVTAIGFQHTAAYSATKGALEALARALSIELAPRGIRINIVSPGMTRTQMTSRLEEDPEQERAAIEATPAGRIGDPEDIANAVVFLASNASSYVLGATLLVDGGFATA